MLHRSSAFNHKVYICYLCRKVCEQKLFYSQELERTYSDGEKSKILQVINESEPSNLIRYDITKARAKYMNQWKSNNGNLKSLTDVDLVEGFSDKYAKKFFDSILKGPMEKEEQKKKKIKGQILHPLLTESIRQNCKLILTVDIFVNCVCWALIDRQNNELLQWEYYEIDYPDGKRFQISDIMEIAWKVTQCLPQADIYAMKAEATTLRAAGSDPNNPKVLAVNLQKAQMVAMIVALINARRNQTQDSEDVEETGESFKHTVYFLRPSLPYRLYGTLVGNERVSTEQTVEALLQESQATDKSHRMRVSQDLRNMFASQNELRKDMLGHCFLLASTFMDLCIYKKKDIVDKLS